MILDVEKKDFNDFYAIALTAFVNVSGKHVSQFVKISANSGTVFFEYFNEKEYLKASYSASIVEEGSSIISFDIIKIILSLGKTISIKSNKDSLIFSDSKKTLNVPTCEIEFNIQMPFSKRSEIVISSQQIADDIKYLKTVTGDADVSQDRFKNIMINSSGETRLMIAATGHLLVFLKKQNEQSVNGQFYIPRSIVGCLMALKRILNKGENVKISNFDSYHTQIETENITIHSSYESKDFVDYSNWKKTETSSAVVVKKSDLIECLNSLLLLKPIYDKVEFSVKDNNLKFNSSKNSQVEMKTIIDITKAKNPLKYCGSFSGGEVRNFIGRLKDDDDVIMGLDLSGSINIIQSADSKLICHVLAIKGV